MANSNRMEPTKKNIIFLQIQHQQQQLINKIITRERERKKTLIYYKIIIFNIYLMTAQYFIIVIAV